MDTTGVGSSYMDLLKGTPIWDRSRSQARFSAPTYCAVCPNAVNLLNNYDGYAKLNYFLSTKSLGSHNIVAGFDIFKEMRKNNQNSSASSYRVQATTAIIDGLNIYPVFRTGTSTYIEWLPVFEETKGSDMRTYSGFLNDVWRLNKRFTFNLGLRYDRNSARDQGGKPVGKYGLHCRARDLYTGLRRCEDRGHGARETRRPRNPHKLTEEPRYYMSCRT